MLNILKFLIAAVFFFIIIIVANYQYAKYEVYENFEEITTEMKKYDSLSFVANEKEIIECILEGNIEDSYINSVFTQFLSERGEDRPITAFVGKTLAYKYFGTGRSMNRHLKTLALTNSLAFKFGKNRIIKYFTNYDFGNLGSISSTISAIQIENGQASIKSQSKIISDFLHPFSNDFNKTKRFNILVLNFEKNGCIDSFK